jgi:hypothetical protein
MCEVRCVKTLEYKNKLLKDNPETLFADFYIDHPLAWHSAIRAHFPYVKREGIGNNLSMSGTVMVQGILMQFQ